MGKVFASLALCCLFIFCACGNENIGPGNYTYNHVHVSDANEGYCATVNSWHDNDRGIELHTKEFGDSFFSEGTYMLFENAAQCPYCGG